MEPSAAQHSPRPLLNQRDLGMMRVFADLRDVIERNLEKSKQRDEKRDGIQSVISGDGLSIVYQPIINVRREGGGLRVPYSFSATLCTARTFGSMRRRASVWAAT